jgi:EpsI family protein
MNSSWRFLTVAALLAGTALLLAARNRGEIVPDHPSFDSFPRAFPGWTSRDIPLSRDVLDVLGPGDFLVRNYRNDEGSASVGLFIAYFPSQRAGDTIHSPQNCLPGAGWSPLRKDRIMIALPGHRPFPANRYLIAKGEERQLVLYWYWAHDRGVASEYRAKFYMIADSIRMHRTDGALVRLSASLAANQDTETVERVLLAFARNIVPLLNTYVPR